MRLPCSSRGLRVAHAPAGIVLAGALFAGGCGNDVPTGSVYFTSGQSDEVVRLDAADGSILRRIPVNRLRVETDEPHALAFAPDGAHWFVTVAHGEPSLWKFEAGTDRLVGRVDLPSGGAAMIGISPDGATAFVPDYDRAGGRVGRVAAVRLTDLAVVAHEAVCSAPHDAAVHPDGDVVAIACAGSDELVLLSASLEELARFPAPASAGGVAHTGGHVPAGGSRPLSVAWSPSGELLAVALHSAGRVWILDRSGATRALIEVGAGPAQLVFIGEDRIATANRMGGSMSIVDLDAATASAVTLPIEYPHGIVVADGRFAYVACEGTPEADGGVVAVDLETRQVLWQRRAGRYVLGITWSPD